MSILVASFEGVQRLNPNPKWSHVPFFLSQCEKYIEMSERYILRGHIKLAVQAFDCAQGYLSLAKDAELRGQSCN